MDYVYTTFDELYDAVGVALEETAGDHGVSVAELGYDIELELVKNLAVDASPSVRREMDRYYGLGTYREISSLTARMRASHPYVRPELVQRKRQASEAAKMRAELNRANRRNRSIGIRTSGR